MDIYGRFCRVQKNRVEAVSGQRASAAFWLRLVPVDAVVDIHVVILSSGEPRRLWSPTTSLIDQVVTEKGWAASLPAHTSYTPTCPSAALTAALEHKICFELTV